MGKEAVMAQPIPRESVLHVLQRRYDHQSAQVVFRRVVESVKLRDQEQYTREELQSISEGLQKVGDRLDSLIAPLMALAGAATATPPAWETSKREPARVEPKAALRAESRPEPPRAESKPQAPRAADAASVVAVTPPAVSPAPASSPTPTTTETAAAAASAEASPTAGAAAATTAEDDSTAHHDDSGEGESENTESGGKGRQRRKR
jgi:outer membrane biosynthesis protein TonB